MKRGRDNSEAKLSTRGKSPHERTSITQPSQPGKSRKPPKAFTDPYVNIDGLPRTEQEKNDAARRLERALAFKGGEKISTTKKAIQKEQLRMKLGRMEERIS